MMKQQYTPEDLKILKCGAAIEAKEHPWAGKKGEFQIAQDHGVEEYRKRCK